MKLKSREFLDTRTNSVHAASIEFWKGEPVFAWFGGSREGAADVSLFIDKLNCNSCLTLGNMDTMPRWNPILFAHDGKLWLFEKAGQFCDRWQTFIHDIGSCKPGEPIKSAQVLPAGLNGPVKTRPVVVGGEIVCGSAVETFHDWTSYMENYTIDSSSEWVLSSRSNPISVKEKKSHADFRGNAKQTLGIIQPAIWEDRNGLHSFFRSSSGLGRIYYSRRINDSWSDDSCWTDPVATNLLNPNSGVDVVCVNEKIYLVSNQSETLRNPISIREIKKNSPEDWETVDELIIRESINEEDKRSSGGACLSEELSYPYMIEHEGELHLVYTYGRKYIEYCVVNLD